MQRKVLDLGQQNSEDMLTNFKSESVANNDRRRQVSEDVHPMILRKRRQSQGLSEQKSVGQTMSASNGQIGSKLVTDYIPLDSKQPPFNLRAVLPSNVTSASHSVASQKSENIHGNYAQPAAFNFHQKPISKRSSQNSSSIIEALLEKQSNDSAASKAILIESAFKKDRIVGQISVKKTAPIAADHDALIQTPPKKRELEREEEQEQNQEQEEQEELVVDSDKSGDEKDSDEDESGDSENEAEKELIEQERLRAEEERKQKEIKDFARANGFTVEFEPKRKEDEKPKHTDSNGKLTKEFFDMQQEKDRRAIFLKSLEEDVAPAIQVMKRNANEREPLRTGFNMGMLQYQIKNNFEAEKAPQGPQIVVTTAKRDLQSSERKSRNGSRIRSSSSSRRLRSEGKDSRVSSATKRPEQVQESETAGENNGEEQVVVQQNVPFTETSLRHLFYLEYKKNFQDGQSNPIVYSRFGKPTYDSDCKFDINNFNQLIRTCNLKKIIKYQENVENGTLRKNQSRYYDPISVPHGDYYTPKDAQDRTLVFESRFESGNLQLVHKQNDNEYDLILQNDINSKGHTQWFFYRVKNVKRGLKVKFNMLNMIKPKSLYNEGMKVLCYSEKKQDIAETDSEVQKGWHRTGEDLSYSQNNYKKEHQTNSQRCYYTFTFTHTFEYDDDVVYFAYSVPYTYSELVNYLDGISKLKLSYVSRNLLCRTLAGNKCEYLTITNRLTYEEDKKKQGVVISSRIHPGESNASWMMKGVIDFLVSNDPQAITLRDKYVFKVIPMLNPDGVINGNYRCSLAGCDLNRRWKYPSQILHPTVYFTKQLITKFSQERKLALYADLHGHSRRKNVFIYGNQAYDNPEASRVFPFLMSKIAQPHYSYDYSRFSVSRYKEQTARIAVWRDLGSKHANIFTLEASFCGPKPVKYEPHRGSRKAPSAQELNYHFNSQDFMDIGKNLCQTLTLFREEEQNPCGLDDIELAIQKYQIEKENKIEQENLIRQQQIITEARIKAQQLLQKTRGGNWNDEKSVPRAPNKDSSAIKEKDGGSTAKKMLNSKSKTMPAYQEDLKDNKKKQKIVYKVHQSDGESNAESDSGPSDDNLDQDQILKLIPKKFGKNKYLRGLDEIKKKKKKVEEEKPKKKKEGPTLMPCMSQKKEREKKMEEVNASHKKEEREKSTAKKVAQPLKLITATIKKGGKLRDVGTQIIYNNKDGQNLSLMELDILRHTGCKWSRIIFPGFKGYIKPAERGSAAKDSFLSAEKFHQDSASRNLRLSQSPSMEQACISKFNADLECDGLRKKPSPFSNEMLQIATDQKDNQMSSLHKKILDTNFQNETRSLFSNNKSGQQRESSKKRRILGIASDEKPMFTNEKLKYNVDLETVVENEGVKQTNSGGKYTIDLGCVQQKESEFKIKRNYSINQQNGVTKKIINGGIVMQSGLKQQLKLDTLLKSAQKPNSQMTQYQSAQKRGSSTKNQLESKASFTNVGQQIMNTSFVADRGQRYSQGNFAEYTSADHKMRVFDLNTINHSIDYSQIANVAPSQMASRLKKIQNEQDARESVLRSKSKLE